MKRFLLPLLTIGLFFSTIPPLHAAGSLPKVTLKTDFQIWEVDLNRIPLFADYEKVNFHGLDVSLDSENSEKVQSYLSIDKKEGVDIAAIRDFLEKNYAPLINREREDVTIRKDDKGRIVFEGRGLYGRTLDSEKAAFLLKEAIEKELTYVNLPIFREDPVVKVEDDELKKMGILELVSAGETNFAGSPANRRHNIKTGLSKFNTHIIKPGEEFVFGNVLGRVDGTTGYLPELVIKGDKTIPEYGGGLCQVSTTAYRAVLSGGFPVTKRQNHSFAVHYYSPTGLDATVYPPSVDLKFMNDYKSNILIQSFMDGDHAYYNFYGTKEERDVHLVGPFYSNFRPAPPARVEYTTTLAPGEKVKYGNPVNGVTSAWYRFVNYEADESKNFTESIISNYQARPLYYAIGASEEDQATKDGQLAVGY